MEMKKTMWTWGGSLSAAHVGGLGSTIPAGKPMEATDTKKKLMWKWSDVKLLNLVAVRLFLGPPKSPRRRMFCKQMIDFVTVRYICSHMFLWQCFVILIIRIRLVNSYLFCFSSFSKFRFWIQYQSVTLSETSAEVWNTWAATQAHSA